MNQRDREYMEKIDGRLRGVETEVALNSQMLQSLVGLARWGIGVVLSLGLTFGGYVFSEIGEIDDRVHKLEAADGDS